MKKVLLIMLSVLCLAGCNKEKTPENNDLVGTKWMTTGYSSYMSLIFGGTWNKWYEFTSNNTLDCYWTDKNGNIIDSDGEMSYTYEYPNLSVQDGDTKMDYQFQDKRTFVVVKVDGTLNKSVTFYKQQ